MKSLATVVGCALLLLAHSAAQAVTWHVPSNAPTIQAGITLASAGDTVLVTCGTYYEYNITMKSGVTLRGETGVPGCVTIDAQSQSCVIVCSGVNNTARIEGLTITHGYTTSPTSAGGILCTGSSPQISDCIFTANSAHSGGGINCLSASSPAITNCTFSDNWVSYGGAGIQCRDYSDPAVTGSVFCGNSGNGFGGAISLTNFCDPVFTNCTFYNNSGLISGSSGSVMTSATFCEPRLVRCIVAFNATSPTFKCYEGGDPALFACDVFGNAGGDYTDCIVGWNGRLDNFRADPLFWDRNNRDFRLHWCSPCVDLPGNGQIGALGPGPVAPRVWHVPMDAPTIQAGVDSAGICDTVAVACGTYYEHDIVMKYGVSLRSETGEPDCVTINAQSLGRVLSCTGIDYLSRVEGLTITGGSAGAGGAIYCSNASLAIANCRIFDNTAADDGGGLACYAASAPNVTRCVFAGNSAADKGGAIYAGSGSWPTVHGCTLYGNSAFGNGGGLATESSSGATVQNSIIAYSSDGEGVYSDSPSGATLSCTDVYGNAWGDWGGSITVQASVNGNLCENPLFWNAGGRDFRLRSCSPCADAPGCGLVGALGTGPGAPRVWRVPQNAPTIAAALDSTATCDSVVVAPGTYYEHDIVLKSDVVLFGEAGGGDGVTIDAQSQGRVFYGSDLGTETRIERFNVTGGVAPDGYGGGMFLTNSSPKLIDCVFTDNTASEMGGGICCFGNSAPTLTGCTVSRNNGGWGGGGIFCTGPSISLTGCTLFGNYNQGYGGAMYVMNSAVALRHSTVCGNSNTQVFCYETQSLTMENTIVAFGTGGAGVLPGGGPITVQCSDIYGNPGGDWSYDLAGHLGVNGNISLDPGFCDRQNGDLRLGSAGSPCAPHTAPNWECELIGAWPVGCAWGGLTSIRDVPHDQGRQIYVTWDGHTFDQPSTPYTITQYSLWRRIDALREKSEPEPAARGLRYPPGNWAFVMTVPASGEAAYTTVAPTLCDSTKADGPCWSVFFVRAHTDNPLVYFDCDPDSGYSLDNLAPSPPANLRMQSSTLLAWDPSAEADFKYFTVYGSELPAFDSETAERIGYTSGASMDISGTHYGYYHVTATDFSGNEGEASTQAISSVQETGAAPAAFYLGTAIPNPSTAVTRISYGIPIGAQRSRVALRVYDPAGRLVSTLVDADHGPGTYRATWMGADDRGQPAANGVYFCRIEWNGRSETRRMVLLK